jgi:hypothetical protein
MEVPYLIDIFQEEYFEWEFKILKRLIENNTETFINGVRSYIKTGKPAGAFRHGEVKSIENMVNKFYVEVCKRRVLVEKKIKKPIEYEYRTTRSY